MLNSVFRMENIIRKEKKNRKWKTHSKSSWRKMIMVKVIIGLYVITT